MHGWTGKIQRVDLTTGSSRREDIPEDMLHAWIGGRGLGVALLREYHSIAPLDPHMPLVFAAGPLCGAKAPCASFLSVVARSPLTSTIYDTPLGGRFPLLLKGAGLDALFITGRAKAPVFLELDETGCRICDAGALWGMETPETASALAGKGSVAAIGPAGEKGVLFAGISVDGASCGRGGLGAVMGGKNLKAVVAAGAAVTSPADPPRLEKGVRDVLRLFSASPFLTGELGIGEYGSATLVDLINQRRMTPTDNFRATFFPLAPAYSGPALRRLFPPKTLSCPGCPIGCGKATDKGVPIPGFEALSHFGALNNNGDLHSILKCSDLCRLLGMDAVSAAASIAAYGAARGRFFTPQELPEIVRMTAHAEGAGELIAQGAQRACARMERPEAAMTAKGLELPPFDPRGAYGMALSYAVSNKGGCHTSAFTAGSEILRKPVATDRFSFSGKARLVKQAEDANAAADSLQVCRFPMLAASLEEYSQILGGVTGIGYSAASLAELGGRIVAEERRFNCRNGFSASEDTLPGRFFDEPGTSGEGISVPPLDKGAFAEELARYYRIRGVDKNGCFGADA